jgi:hypothetical protein
MADDESHLDRTLEQWASGREQTDEDRAYWLSQTPTQRMEALHYERWLVYGDAVFEPMKRVYSLRTLGEGDDDWGVVADEGSRPFGDLRVTRGKSWVIWRFRGERTGLR